MIVLDTNVVSELMKPEPDSRVKRWLRFRAGETLVTTSVTAAEILYGIKRLAEGRRRDELAASFETLMSRGFRNRLLVFDERAAAAHAEIVVARVRQGRAIQIMDAMIAGIARSQAADIATRNASDFEDCGVQILNPWE